MRWPARARALQESLRVQLLLGLLLPLAAIVFVDLSIARANAVQMADTLLDRSLRLSASAIADRIEPVPGGFDVNIPPFALSQLRSPEDDLTYFKVASPSGALLAGYSDVPSVASPPIGEGPRFTDVVFHGELVRFVALRPLVFVNATARGAYVFLGKTLRERNATIFALERQAAIQQGLLALMAALLAWLGLRRDLMPLVRLGREVRRREPGDLAPLPENAVQRELRPFVTALNDHLARQRRLLEAQRRFVANAAHQLRTPLTLLRMQADYALRETNPDERGGAVAALAATTERITRLAKQLLRLSEAESQATTAARAQPTDLAALARDVLEGSAGLALSRDIDLGLDADETNNVIALGDPTMLRELILNLVDNALRYVQAGAVVTVRVAYDGDMCLLRVEDDGPGIPAAERDLVFERFYRILGSDAEGSGLGLAIVKEIVESSAGEISLGEPERGPGLVVSVRLRRGDDASANKLVLRQAAIAAT